MKSFKLILKSTLFFALLATMSVAVSSCGDDEPEIIMGCTDSVADNYNADATDENGSCTYQDRFSGTWPGTFSCQGLLAALFTSADVTVAPGATSDAVGITVTSSTLPFPIPLNGTITRDDLTINVTLPNVEFTGLDIIPGYEGEMFNITVAGTLSISEDNSTLSGDLNFTLEETTSGGIIPTITDTCNFTATK
jgi:hypothetical protein